MSGQHAIVMENVNKWYGRFHVLRLIGEARAVVGGSD
mgnify:CR=1 FL=1